VHVYLFDKYFNGTLWSNITLKGTKSMANLVLTKSTPASYADVCHLPEAAGSPATIDLNSAIAICDGTSTKRHRANNVRDFMNVPIFNVWRDGEAYTGYLNRDQSYMAFDDGSPATRTFTIAPRAGSISGSPPYFDYYIHGIRYESYTPISLTIPNITGEYFLYIDVNNTIQYTTIFDATLLFVDNVYVAVLYWNADLQQAIYFGDERHGMVMDGVTHAHFHLSFGTQFISGLAPGGTFTADPGTPIDADVQIDIGNGFIRDEDIPHHIYDIGSGVNSYDLLQDLTPIAQLPVFYRMGTKAVWYKSTPTNFPFIYSDGVNFTGAVNGLPPYNSFVAGSPGGWALTEVSDNSFFLFHILATNDMRHPIIALQGIAEYATAPAAQAGANSELNSLSGLPFQEFTPIATFICQARTLYTNTPQVRFRLTDQGSSYVDWRNTQVFSATIGSSATDHGNLSGLADDDHKQYLLTNGTRVPTGPLTLPTYNVATLPSAGTAGQIIYISDGKDGSPIDGTAAISDGTSWRSVDSFTIPGTYDDHDNLVFPDQYPETYSYNADGSLNTVSKTDGVTSWVMTFAYGTNPIGVGSPAVSVGSPITYLYPSNVRTVTVTDGTNAWVNTHTYNPGGTLIATSGWIKQ